MSNSNDTSRYPTSQCGFSRRQLGEILSKSHLTYEEHVSFHIHYTQGSGKGFINGVHADTNLTDYVIISALEAYDDVRFDR